MEHHVGIKRDTACNLHRTIPPESRYHHLAARRSHCCRGLRRLQLLRLLATICPSREQMASPVAIEVGLNSDELCTIRAASLPTPTTEMFLAQCIPQTNVALLLGESYQASAATAQGCAEPAGPAVLLTH